MFTCKCYIYEWVYYGRPWDSYYFYRHHNIRAYPNLNPFMTPSFHHPFPRPPGPVVSRIIFTAHPPTHTVARCIPWPPSRPGRPAPRRPTAHTIAFGCTLPVCFFPIHWQTDGPLSEAWPSQSEMPNRAMGKRAKATKATTRTPSGTH